MLRKCSRFVSLCLSFILRCTSGYNSSSDTISQSSRTGNKIFFFLHITETHTAATIKIVSFLLVIFFFFFCPSVVVSGSSHSDGGTQCTMCITLLRFVLSNSITLLHGCGWFFLYVHYRCPLELPRAVSIQSSPLQVTWERSDYDGQRCCCCRTLSSSSSFFLLLFFMMIVVTYFYRAAWQQISWTIRANGRLQTLLRCWMGRIGVRY